LTSIISLLLDDQQHLTKPSFPYNSPKESSSFHTYVIFIKRLYIEK